MQSQHRSGDPSPEKRNETNVPSSEKTALGGDLGSISQQVNSAFAELTRVNDEIHKHQDELESASSTLAEFESELERHESELVARGHDLDERAAQLRQGEQSLEKRKVELAEREKAVAEFRVQLARVHTLLETPDAEEEPPSSEPSPSRSSNAEQSVAEPTPAPTVEVVAQAPAPTAVERLDLSDLSAEELGKFHTQRALSTYSDEEIAHRIRVARVRPPHKARTRPANGSKPKKKRVWF